ncbi:MAG: tetratricopeptide repeat protein [Kofleriaceae bacterium]|nr:tetratricopeptide repeat protein [Kofleriaceae bacterium]
MSLRLAALLVCAVAGDAFADGASDAKVHVDKAMVAHREGRWEDAKAELEAAYALDPKPQLLYALGQVHVKLGRCEEAIARYEEFVRSGPPDAARESANQAIVTCKVALAHAEARTQHEVHAATETTAKPATAPAMDVTASEASAVPAVRAVERPWYRDRRLGISLMGVGAASTVVGTLLYVRARGTVADAEDAPTYDEAARLVEDARRSRTMSVVLGATGIAMIAGGVVYLVRVERRETRQVGVVPTTSGGLVTLSGRF